eukprot:TRINITY_DN6788_c0_g1_i2.p1 TRINITY_DN6788_c0_g1~~TRINITY_DN6788_c0_g1_i2.p1  ORF type:complete len:251 (+),score=30.95 TRINITY_DN6788_c0_g1_i2:43-753(+)
MYKKTFVIVVDVQNDFIDPKGSLPVPNGTKIIKPLLHFLSKQTESNCEGILWTFDTHDPITFPKSEEAKTVPPHCYIGTRGWDLALNRTIVTHPNQYFMSKRVFSMWADKEALILPFPSDEKNKTPGPQRTLIQFFKTLKTLRKVTTIRICGVATDICVSEAIQGSLDLGFEVEVDPKMTAGVSEDIFSLANTRFEAHLREGRLKLVGFDMDQENWKSLEMFNRAKVRVTESSQIL